MKISMVLVSLILLAGFITPAQAETAGRGTRLDARIQSALYNPDNVYRIYAMKNRTTSIQLEPGETINAESGAMNLGKPGNRDNPEWLLGANKEGSLIMIKPSQYAEEPQTNLIINTNRRTYLFELNLADSAARMTYLFRFTYPQPVKPGETPFKGRELNVNPCSGTENHNWKKRGNMAMSPARIWSNGTFTCLRFPTNAPRPAVWEVLPDGSELTANWHSVNDIMVIHGISAAYRLRMNQMVLELRTSTPDTGWYNYNGTTTGDIREVKK